MEQTELGSYSMDGYNLTFRYLKNIPEDWSPEFLSGFFGAEFQLGVYAEVRDHTLFITLDSRFFSLPFAKATCELTYKKLAAEHN